MIFSGIFKRFFKRKAKTYFLDIDEMLNHDHAEDESNLNRSVFEIAHAVTIRERISLISGYVRRGFFRTGDSIDVCSSTNAIPKFNAMIIGIKTALVDVNKIGSGSEADLIIELPNTNCEIESGDKVYKY